ncbi:hypothetical protein [Enterococcus phage EFGrKN]|uniref:Uncharacterized protein n=1 Tax=Enterococcus phage EFGrKN TaxID=2777300 RepID=A0A7S6TWZ2_9CAUD|nr:hypothetical protein [Enterococcus phage EFGrKN]
MKYHTELYDVVQIVPHFDETFGGCFATVSEVKDWGVVAYVCSPGVPGVAYVRLTEKDYAPLKAKARFIVEED